jgi:hypothetical protein
MTGTLGWWTWLLWWWGKPFVAKAPACTAYADSVDYEFTSKDYAVDFATLNIDAAWVKVNGEIINQ